jgi:hypothetical protein
MSDDRTTDAEGLVIPTPEEIAEQEAFYAGPEHSDNDGQEVK